MPAKLTCTRLAKELGVSPDAVRMWCREGKIRSLRTAGGHYRIPREELALLLAGRDVA